MESWGNDDGVIGTVVLARVGFTGGCMLVSTRRGVVSGMCCSGTVAIVIVEEEEEALCCSETLDMVIVEEMLKRCCLNEMFFESELLPEF